MHGEDESPTDIADPRATKRLLASFTRELDRLVDEARGRLIARGLLDRDDADAQREVWQQVREEHGEETTAANVREKVALRIVDETTDLPRRGPVMRMYNRLVSDWLSATVFERREFLRFLEEYKQQNPSKS